MSRKQNYIWVFSKDYRRDARNFSLFVFHFSLLLVLRPFNQWTSKFKRVAILVDEKDGVVILLLLYDKADASSIKMNVVRKIIKDIGLDLEKLQTEGKLKLPQKEWHIRVRCALTSAIFHQPSSIIPHLLPSGRPRGGLLFHQSPVLFWLHNGSLSHPRGNPIALVSIDG